MMWQVACRQAAGGVPAAAGSCFCCEMPRRCVWTFCGLSSQGQKLGGVRGDFLVSILPRPTFPPNNNMSVQDRPELPFRITNGAPARSRLSGNSGERHSLPEFRRSSS